MIRKLLIKWLFKLLSDSEMYEHIDDRKIELWLQAQFTNQGFREYYRKRTIILLKTIGAGVNHDNYMMYLGQRFELLKLLQEVSRAHKLQMQVEAMAKAKKKEANPNTNKVIVSSQRDEKGGE